MAPGPPPAARPTGKVSTRRRAPGEGEARTHTAVPSATGATRAHSLPSRPLGAGCPDGRTDGRPRARRGLPREPGAGKRRRAGAGAGPRPGLPVLAAPAPTSARAAESPAGPSGVGAAGRPVGFGGRRGGQGRENRGGGWGERAGAGQRLLRDELEEDGGPSPPFPVSGSPPPGPGPAPAQAPEPAGPALPGLS